jgi:hypothetical protein
MCIGDADYPLCGLRLYEQLHGRRADTISRGLQGYFQADALAQYEGLYGDDNVKHVCCVAHARRKFVAASDAGDERAAKALELIGRLYAIERALPPLLPPSDDPAQREHRRHREEHRHRLRQRDALPVRDELSKWLGEQKPGARPKSPLGTAIGYSLIFLLVVPQVGVHREPKVHDVSVPAFWQTPKWQPAGLSPGGTPGVRVGSSVVGERSIATSTGESGPNAEMLAGPGENPDN